MTSTFRWGTIADVNRWYCDRGVDFILARGIVKPSHPHAFEMKLFAPTGDLAGLCIVSKDTWTGKAVVFSRENYKEVVGRKEFKQIGVYVLIADSEESTPTIYIGEGDPVKNRLSQHYGKKDFWELAVFFVAKDDEGLNKAHIQRLEARLFGLARTANRCKLLNVQPPQPPTLSEAETNFVESFLREVLSIFKLLGLRVFENSEATRKSDETVKLKATKALLLPQARILQALLPVAGKKPSMSHGELAQRIDVSPTSGTIPVAMGGRR